MHDGRGEGGEGGGQTEAGWRERGRERGEERTELRQGCRNRAVPSEINLVKVVKAERKFSVREVRIQSSVQNVNRKFSTFNFSQFCKHSPSVSLSLFTSLRFYHSTSPSKLSPLSSFAFIPLLLSTISSEFQWCSALCRHPMLLQHPVLNRQLLWTKVGIWQITSQPGGYDRSLCVNKS